MQTRQTRLIDVATLALSIKVAELRASLRDANGALLSDRTWRPEFGGDDTLAITINLDTGQIIDWVSPTPQQLEAHINGDHPA